MVTHNLDIIGLPILPPETDAPPVVDANAMLADTVALQSFESISSNGSQVVKISRRMKPTEPFPSSPLDVLKLPAAEAIMQGFGF